MPFIGTKIETTVSNFRDMVKDNCLLVDKTLMIKEFWGGKKTALITRPRRFGKTLNMSMLQHFFAGSVDGRPTKGLFDNLNIAKFDDGAFLKVHQGQYPVIFISFKDVKEFEYEAAVNKIKKLIQKIYREYENTFGPSCTSLTPGSMEQFIKYLWGEVDDQDLEGALSFLSECLYKAHSKKVIILIDEYDTPLSSAHEYKYLDKLSVFMRNLFSAALKDNAYLEKGLMTGILRVSKNTMLSGLNNLEVYTLLEDDYGQYFGFTEQEVQELIEHQGVTEDVQRIREYYNGYKIGTHIVYNPWSLMSFLDKGLLRPYWVLTSNDKLLKEVLLQSNEDDKVKLNALMRGETVEGRVSVNLVYEALVGNPDSLWSLLLFCGYLKAESARVDNSDFICQLRIPNQEIVGQYKSVFIDWFRERMGSNHYDSLLKALVEGRVEEFTQRVRRFLFSCTSSHDFTSENSYHIFMLTLLASLTDTHHFLSNKEYGAGRSDIVVIPKDPTKTQGTVFEFKYLKLGDPNKKDVFKLKAACERSAMEAFKQIEARGYEAAFWGQEHIKTVLKVGMCFSNRYLATSYATTLKEAVSAPTPQEAIAVVCYDAREAEESEEDKYIQDKKKAQKRSHPSSDEEIQKRQKRADKPVKDTYSAMDKVAHTHTAALLEHSTLPGFFSPPAGASHLCTPTVKTYQGGGLTFERHAVLGDGDCGYTAFGITRELAYQRIQAPLALAAVQVLLLPAVREALASEAFCVHLNRAGVVGTGVTHEDIWANIERFANNLNVVSTYLDYDIHQKRVEGGWAHPAVLRALACVQQIELHLWVEGEDNELAPHPVFPAYVPEGPVAEQQRIDLLFTNGNHFERLEATQRVFLNHTGKLNNTGS